ncbi:hypothetical protein LP417_08235 [Polaromonas sp. P1-6]|nr:hypothetical protein LP417_08235 [Polaromonas sp. P1-6]
MSLNCEFSAISRMGDEVVLGLSVERVGTKSLTLWLDCRLYQVLRVRSRQVSVTIDLQTRCHRAI